MDFDVLIIGAGITGSAIARELAKTDLAIGVLEKESDICEGTTKANSGIAHAGYDAIPGTLKAKLNVQGSKMMKQLSLDLGFDYINNGSLVLCFDENGRAKIQEIYERGLKNGVEDLQILEKEEILEKEPNVSEQVVCALYAPTAGIVDPFTMNAAFAENAADNGVTFIFDEPATEIQRTSDGWLVNGKYSAKAIINAAGVYADQIHNLVSDEQMTIRPRRGQYFLLDKAAGNKTKITLFQLPTIAGKGVLVAPTCHGNLIVGPTAEFVEDKEELNTTAQGLSEVRSKAVLTIPDLPFNQVITSFSGLRAVPEHEDFVIEESVPGFIDVAGIESPGLTSAPAIGVMVADMVRNLLNPEDRPDFNPYRKGFINVNDLTKEQWNQLIKEDPEYGKIICRCETVTAGQIRDTLRRSVPARTLDGVKRRVRAGMGRCQSGFCSPKTMEIIAEETGIPLDQVKKSGLNSTIITGNDKEKAEYDR